MKFKIFRFNKVKSTNNTAIRIIKNYNYDFGMILSDLQVNGRGQYGKKWVSYKGNLFVSFFYNLKNFKISFNKLTKMDDKNFLREIVDDEITPKRKKLEEIDDLYEKFEDDGLDYEVNSVYGQDIWKKASK